jgi:hypothetical protein
LTVDVSVLLDETISKEVPPTIEAVGAERVPGVPARVFDVRKIFDEAVTAVVDIVIAPAVIATDVPIDALAPVAILILLPAVPKTRLPLVAVMAPAVAVSVVDAVNEPVTAVFPVALPMLTAPVPPVPIVVTAAPLVLMVVVPTALSVVAWTGRGVVLPKPRTGGEAKLATVLKPARVAGEMYT